MRNSSIENKGKLYLIPVPLGETDATEIPVNTKTILKEMQYFIVEKGKTARYFLKKLNPEIILQQLIMDELSDNLTKKEIETLLLPTLAGKNIGLLSEAGCPGIADPGAKVVEVAYSMGIEVVPFVGPSSIILALMASGMNGQKFCFHGYLSAKSNELPKELKQLEQDSQRYNQTQIFIETPYRNKNMVETVFQTLKSTTKFCIACDLTLPTQFILSLTIAEWKKQNIPDLHKRPTVFLILA